MPAIRIVNRDAHPEILSILQRADGVEYAVKVTDGKNPRGYDLVKVLVGNSGMTHATSAARSRIAPGAAVDLVKQYVRETEGLHGTPPRARMGRHLMVPATWSGASLGSSEEAPEMAFQQASNDGRRHLLKAAAQARRGDCGQAVENLAIGANRIGSALTHGASLRAWPEPTKSLMTAQRAAVADVARFCRLTPSGLSGAASRRRSRKQR